jgi:molybdenum cofactor cytidylyltransferase
MTATLAVILAAGRGSRFAAGTHKLLADLDGRSVVERAVEAAVEAAVGDVLVVVGAVALPPAVAATPGVRVVHEPRWYRGQAKSLQRAISEARRLGVDAVVIGLGDQPGIDPSAWRAVAASSAPIAVATYDGAPRNPVRLDQSVWHLLPAEGDEGARVVARTRPELVEPIPCVGSPADIDTTKDLAQWLSRSSTNSR